MSAEDAVRKRLEAGDTIHMEYDVDGRRCWWMENPYQKVPERIMQRIMAEGAAAEAGDSLFGRPGTSQTWRGRAAAPS